jgi:hypothetical protein
MKQLKELTPKEIFADVQKFCVLSDIDPPQDEQSLIMMIDFIKQNHGNYDARILTWAFELWMQGDVDVNRPRRINAYFVSQIIKKCVKDNLIKHPYPPQPARMIQSKVLSDQEELELSQRTYHRLYDEFVAYYRSNDVKLVLKLLEVQYRYIYEHIDKMIFNHTQLHDMHLEVLKYYEHRTKALEEEDKLYHWNAIPRSVPSPPVDMSKVIPVWAHFYQRYKTNQKN